MLFIEYPKCSTCKKAKKLLDLNNIKYVDRDIKVNNPTEEELRFWHKKSNLPLIKFFNTSGTKYKELNLKEKLNTMSLDEQFKLLATDGMLVKRPIIIDKENILIGFKEENYKKLIKGE